MKRLLFVVLLLAGAVVVPVGPTEAAACSGTSGVTVVVDYDNGSTRVGCAPGDPTSGFDALKKAGFSITFATGNGLGALCSIDNVPSNPCTSMPPTSAYWAYFHAKPGGSWSYSNVGGGGYDPKPGTVEGWHYRGSPTNPPSLAPPGTASTPTPTSRPTIKPTVRPTSGASNPVVGPDETVQPTPGQPTASSSGASSTPTPGATATATDDSTPSADATDGPGATAAESPSDSRAEADDSSGGLSWIWGVVLVAVVAAGAGATALRRRKV